MFFNIALYLSLTICIAGVFYKILTWFKLKIGQDALQYSFGERVSFAVKGIFAVLFSSHIFKLIKVLISDIFFQAKILKGKMNVTRISMHFFIFFGFMFLFFMHALGNQVAVLFFPEYIPTLNPFMFLRNLSGLFVISGLIIALYRRKTVSLLKATINFSDKYIVIIIAVIIISGFLLEGVKIISAPVYDQMVEDYAGLEEPDEIKALKLYWSEKFGVVFPVTGKYDSSLFEQGRELHKENCMDCHVQPNYAFISYPIAKIVSFAGNFLNNKRADVWLWYIHILACFIALAYLPFSKLFHIISSPVTLIANGILDKSQIKPANLITLRAVSLDACTHCGTCSLSCSVMPVMQNILNKNILPSEKLISLKAVVSGKNFSNKDFNDFCEGSFICTECYKCTNYCPVGINLQDLWIAAKKDLKEKGVKEPYIQARDSFDSKWSKNLKDKNIVILPDYKTIFKHLNISNQASTFSSCFKCSTCTSSCPVVANYENPIDVLGMVPHQIMHSLALGLGEMILGTQMIWNCTTCYLCQENCPQDVKITDIFYELRNLAQKQISKENINKLQN